jgi:hypothetical protein
MSARVRAVKQFWQWTEEFAAQFHLTVSLAGASARNGPACAGHAREIDHDDFLTNDGPLHRSWSRTNFWLFEGIAHAVR